MSKRRGMLDTLVFAMALRPLAGCGGAEDADEAASEAPSGEAAAPVQVADAGTIRGQIMFTGTAPAGQPIDMTEEASYAAKHTTPVTTEEVVVNDAGALGNVFVYVKEGLPAQTYPTPTSSVTLDQMGCVYTPHVIGVQTGQPLLIKNSDDVAHNIKAVPTINRGFNISQNRAMETPREFDAAEIMVPVECNIHSWMKAYIGVVDHPYFAVTSADGSFQIPNLPPGTYVVEAWHETYGTQTMNVTVAPNGTSDTNFSYQATSARANVPMADPIDLHDHSNGHQAFASIVFTRR